MIEIIGEIRDATLEELEKFRKIQKELAENGASKEQDALLKSGRDENLRE